MTERKTVDVCGVNFDSVTAKEAREILFAALEGKREQTMLSTANPEIVLACEKDAGFKDVINNAELVVADGIGVIKAAAMIGTPLPERIPGIELGEAMMSYCAERGEKMPVYLLGGKPGVAEEAAAKLGEKYPGLAFAGVHDGYYDMNGEENEKILAEMNEKGAVLVLVCVGAPKQEKWIAANRNKLQSVKVLAGLGGSLDVYSGRSKRAPALFCKLGLEWFYRLIKEPSRIGRMSKLPLILIHARRYKKQKDAKNQSK